MLAYIKVPPTTHLIHYQGGRLRRQGPGLAFWYFGPASTIVAIPLASRDVPFAFSEVTADFQPVTLQGQLTYRVADPGRLANLLDFSIRRSGQFISDDPEKLPERLVQTAQILARAVVQRLTLREVLVNSDTIVAEVAARRRAGENARHRDPGSHDSLDQADARHRESAGSRRPRGVATTRGRGHLLASQRFGGARATDQGK